MACRRAPLYQVRFLQRDLWPEYAVKHSDTLVVNIYEHWLNPVEGDKIRNER